MLRRRKASLLADHCSRGVLFNRKTFLQQRFWLDRRTGVLRVFKRRTDKFPRKRLNMRGCTVLTSLEEAKVAPPNCLPSFNIKSRYRRLFTVIPEDHESLEPLYQDFVKCSQMYKRRFLFVSTMMNFRRRRQALQKLKRSNEGCHQNRAPVVPYGTGRINEDKHPNRDGSSSEEESLQDLDQRLTRSCIEFGRYPRESSGFAESPGRLDKTNYLRNKGKPFNLRSVVSIQGDASPLPKSRDLSKSLCEAHFSDDELSDYSEDLDEGESEDDSVLIRMKNKITIENLNNEKLKTLLKQLLENLDNDNNNQCCEVIEEDEEESHVSEVDASQSLANPVHSFLTKPKPSDDSCHLTLPSQSSHPTTTLRRVNTATDGKRTTSHTRSSSSRLTTSRSLHKHMSPQKFLPIKKQLTEMLDLLKDSQTDLLSQLHSIDKGRSAISQFDEVHAKFFDEMDHTGHHHYHTDTQTQHHPEDTQNLDTIADHSILSDISRISATDATECYQPIIRNDSLSSHTHLTHHHHGHHHHRNQPTNSMKLFDGDDDDDDDIQVLRHELSERLRADSISSFTDSSSVMDAGSGAGGGDHVHIFTGGCV